MCNLCGSADCTNCFSDEAFEQWLHNQPTAYDIDKVVEQLEFEKGVAFMTLGNTGDEDYDFAYDNVIQYMNTAIKIVKGNYSENPNSSKGGAE